MSDWAPGRAVLPSIMSADFMRLGEQADALMAAGARIFHVDVMDGRFVPNLTLGPDVCAALAARVRPAGGAIDVHLMVERPGAMIAAFAPHADAISVHLEADPHPHRLLQMIREAGCRAGLAINPGTPPAAAAELAAELDYVNVMSVNPGYAGQRFIAATPARIARLRELLPAGAVIEVDGGIAATTLPAAAAAGADLLVSASAIFGAADPIASYRELARLAVGAGA